MVRVDYVWKDDCYENSWSPVKCPLQLRAGQTKVFYSSVNHPKHQLKGQIDVEMQ